MEWKLLKFKNLSLDAVKAFRAVGQDQDKMMSSSQQ